jgi:carbon monoxide dehydrogenase subunit G
MKITIDKSLDLPLTPDLAWEMLKDMEGIAACLPGAKITERVDETHYKGTVTVKLGPATVSFKGNIEVASADPVERRMHIIGTGSDTGGTSGASLDLHAWVQALPDGGSSLSGKSEVSVTGKVAAFGARLMNSVSEVLLGKFFTNLGAHAAAIQAAQPVAAMSTTTSAAAPAPVVAVQAPAPAADIKLNALSLVWAVIKDFVGGLFRRTKAT